MKSFTCLAAVAVVLMALDVSVCDAQSRPRHQPRQSFKPREQQPLFGEEESENPRENHGGNANSIPEFRQKALEEFLGPESCWKGLLSENSACLAAMKICTSASLDQRYAVCARVLDACQHKCPYSTCSYRLRLEGVTEISHHLCWPATCYDSESLNHTLHLANLTAQAFLNSDGQLIHITGAQPVGSFQNFSLSCSGNVAGCNSKQCNWYDVWENDHGLFYANQDQPRQNQTTSTPEPYLFPEDEYEEPPSDFPIFSDEDEKDLDKYAESCGANKCSGRRPYCCAPSGDRSTNRTYGCCGIEELGMFQEAVKPLDKATPQCQKTIYAKYRSCFVEYSECLSETLRLAELVAHGDVYALNNGSLEYLMPHCRALNTCVKNNVDKCKLSSCVAHVDDSGLPLGETDNGVTLCLPDACLNEVDVPVITRLLHSSFCSPLCTVFTYWSENALLAPLLRQKGFALNQCPLRDVRMHCTDGIQYIFGSSHSEVNAESCTDFVSTRLDLHAARRHFHRLATWQLAVAIAGGSIIGVVLLAVFVRYAVRNHRRRQQESELSYSYTTLSDESTVPSTQ